MCPRVIGCSYKTNARIMATTTRKYGKIEPVYATSEALAALTTRKMPDRPARVQMEQKRALQQAEHLGEYNIWYGKYIGERNYERAPKAVTRVCLETDDGVTRADYTSATAWICLHFARGDCIYGKDCTFRHCAPTEDDETMADSPHDIFGRNRHASWRDDMGGTGTWNKECKTIYVGRLCSTPAESAITETVVRHFGEFGPIESVRALKPKGCAFVTYKLRCTAEFAKEAMAEQSLDHDEQLNVRWAYDDPNPKAQAIRLRNNAQIMLAAMAAKGHIPNELPPDEFYDEWGDEPHSKRPRVEGEGGGSSSTPMTREEHAQQLADAESQREAEAAEAEAEALKAAEEARQQQAISEANRLDAILSSIDSARGGETQQQAAGGATAAADPLADFLRNVGGEEQAPAPAPAGDTGVGGRVTARDAEVEMPPGVWQPRGLPAGWREFADPTTGHPYYVGPTGESTWRKPVG